MKQTETSGSAGRILPADLAQALDYSYTSICSQDGTIDFWAGGCQRLYGWTASEALGRKSQELLQTRFPIPEKLILEALVAVGEWRGDLKQRHKDGRTLIVSAEWTVLPARDGFPPRIIAIHADANARHELEELLEATNERFKQMSAELERSNAELEDFARIASHDLGAPITTTRWLADLLATRHARQLDEDGRNCLRQISLSLERMADLIDAVLAHALSGKNAISSQEECDTNLALDGAIENLRRDIAMSGAVINRSPLPNLRIQTQALTQVFQNLLSNAIKYRRSDVPLRIDIEAARETNGCVIEVRDNGLGIEKAWFERIFLPLQRRHGVGIKGSGIGLATCKKIVSRAGGEIWVESELGVGSAFYFSIPSKPA